MAWYSITGYALHPNLPIQQEWTLSIYTEQDKTKFTIWDNLGHRSEIVSLNKDEVKALIKALEGTL